MRSTRFSVPATTANPLPPAAVWLVVGWHHRWITDDGLIAVRTVRQILAGHGPVFNPGERIEPNTLALWTWLLAAAAWITGADVYAVVQATGLILAPAGLLFAILGSRNVQRRLGSARPLVPFGALVLAALPPSLPHGSLRPRSPNYGAGKGGLVVESGPGLTCLGDFVGPSTTPPSRCTPPPPRTPSGPCGAANWPTSSRRPGPR